MKKFSTDRRKWNDTLKKDFRSFLNILNDSKYKIVMRGDSYYNLQELYNDNVDNSGMLGYYLFMLGPKARKFLTKKEFIDANNTETDNFIYICKKALNYLYAVCRESKNENKKHRIKEYISNNPSLVTFLKNVEKNNNIINKYNILEPKDKVTINMYYLSLVHTINPENYKETSCYVSTSTKQNVAERFSNRDIIIYAWYSPNYAVSDDTAQSVLKLGFPTYQPVFPEQNEISFIYGILPHFIIGFEDIKEECFYINPAIFDAMDKITSMSIQRVQSIYINKILNFGLEIDQESFDAILKETNLKGYYQYQRTKDCEVKLKDCI